MRRVLFLLPVVAALVACGTTAPAPDDHFYRLTPPAATSSQKQRLTDSPISVSDFLAGGLYNDRAILFSNDVQGRELQQHHYYFWYTSPPGLLRDYLVQVLRNADVSPLILGGSGANGNFRISGILLAFERREDSAGATVQVALELRLDKPGTEAPLLLRQYHAGAPVTGKDMPAVISAFNTAVDSIFGDFLGDLAAALHVP